MTAVNAEPYEFEFDPKTTALVMIDFQRDFVDPGGFGEALGNDVSLLRRAVPPAERVAQGRRAARAHGHPHPRRSPARPVRLPAGQEGARPSQAGIGDPGPMGRILVRGE